MHARAWLVAFRYDANPVWLWPLLQRKHPSALGKFEQIASACKGKKVVMFLDYDGTLSPIVADPDAAYMSDAVRPRAALSPRSLAPGTHNLSWRPAGQKFTLD